MPQNVRSKQHEQHSRLFLKNGAFLALRRSFAGAYSTAEQGGPLTPVPTWKLYENPSYRSLTAAASGSVASVTGLKETEEEEDDEEEGDLNEEDKEWVQKVCVEEADFEVMSTSLREGSSSHLPFLSARKLAASLWDELQEEGQRDSRVTICDCSESSPRSHLQSRPLSLSNSESPDSAKHHHPSKGSQQTTRSSQPPPSLSPPLKAIMLMRPNAGCTTSQLQSSASKAANSCQFSSPGKDVGEDPGDGPDKYECVDADSSTSPSNFMEASSRSQVDSSLVEFPLCEELKQALSKVHEVEAAQISARKEVDDLLRRCADEIITLRTREQEKIQAAVLSIAGELDMERRARRNAEMENQRLAVSLADASKVVLAAEKELEEERKARQLMEDVCDELAREIGEDKTQVEELKRELAKVRDEIEEERKTLQVTEAWREERVQMKLSEAKLELEERCLSLDNLKLELESFLNRGKVRRVGAFIDRGGETLRKAIEKLQGETSESVFFLKDAKLFSSPHSVAMSSNNVQSQQNTCFFKKNGSSVCGNMYDKNGIQQTIRSGDFGWNVESEGFSMEENDWSESTSAYRNEHDKQRINCMRASRRRRGGAGMRSYESKARGLSSMGDRGLREDSFNNFECRITDDSDTESRGDSSSESRLSSQEEGNWNADCDDDNGVLRHRGIASWSASEVEDERGLRFSPKFGEKRANRSLEMVSVKNRHGAARVKQGHGGKGATRAKQNFHGDAHLEYVFSQTRHDMLASEDDSGLSSVIGYSPMYQSHMPSPDLLAKKGSSYLANPSKRSASLGRKTVHNSVDSSKPYKRNSLQSKLLLEDRLIGRNFKLKH